MIKLYNDHKTLHVKVKCKRNKFNIKQNTHRKREEFFVLLALFQTNIFLVVMHNNTKCYGTFVASRECISERLE